MLPPNRKHWATGRPQLVSDMIAIAAAAESIHPTAVLSRSHEPPCVRARRDVICQLRRRGYSLTRIGRLLGGLHHSSVLYNLKQAEQKPPKPTVPTWNPDVPDESGIWAI